MSDNKNDNEVFNQTDIKKYNKQNVVLYGLYQSIAAPHKGLPLQREIKENAIVILNDGTEVFLETIDSPYAKRSNEERNSFEHRDVAVAGTIHTIMPSKGAGLLAPCITDISSICENKRRE